LVANRNKFANNIQNKYRYKKADTINVNLDNRAKGLFDSLGLSYQKIPTLNHNEKLPDQIEGVYKKDNLSLRKNPRVSDKKAEAVAMHEIYHHIQKDKGMNLADEEQGANLIEQAYLNENQQASQEPDFDLIYAHTIRQFYEHDELEQLVRVFGGDSSSARRLYSNAMRVIVEAKKEKKHSEKFSTQLKKVNDDGLKYKKSENSFSSDMNSENVNVATLSIHSDIDTTDFGISDLKNGNVGHSWVSLKWNNSTDIPSKINKKYPKHAKYLKRNNPFGFWPRMFASYDEATGWVGLPAEERASYSINPFSSYVKGQVVHPDTLHTPKATQEYAVTEDEASAVMKYAESKKSADYSVYFFNCTTFASDAIKSAGKTPPSSTSMGIAYPNKLYESIKKNKKERK